MLKEHGPPIYGKYIKMNELTALVKTVNKKHFKKDATDLINLDFEGFKFFIV